MGVTKSMRAAAMAHFGTPSSSSSSSSSSGGGSSGGGGYTAPKTYNPKDPSTYTIDKYGSVLDTSGKMIQISNPSQLPTTAQGYNPAWTPWGGGALPPSAAYISELPEGWAGLNSEQRAAALGGSLSSPIKPTGWDTMTQAQRTSHLTKIAEEASRDVRQVFGSRNDGNWQKWKEQTTGKYYIKDEAGIKHYEGSPEYSQMHSTLREFQTGKISTLPTGASIAGPQVAPPPIATQLAPDQPLTPESTIQGIQSVFGPQWQPAPAFAELQKQGIYGAVRIAGTNEVYTLGTGGAKHVSADEYRNLFNTDEQEGIVGEISREQAIALGITDTGQTAIAGDVSSDILKEEPEIDLSNISPGNTSDSAVVSAGVNTTIKTLQEEIDALTLPETEDSQRVDDLIDKLEGTLGETEGRGEAQLAAEEEYKVQEKKDLYNSLKNQLTTKMAEINALEADYNLQNQIVEGETITLSRMQGQQAQNYKMYLAQKNSLTAEAGLIQARALAAQGDLASAQDAANRAVDLKYADIEQRFNNQLTMYNLLEGKVSKDDAIRLEALRNYNSNQQSLITEQKQVEKDIQNIALSVVGVAPNSVIDQISRMTDVMSAAKLAAPYLQETVSGGVTETNFKFTPTVTGYLSSIGLSPSQVNDIQYQIRTQDGFDSTGLTEEQVNRIKSIVEGQTPTQIREAEEEAAEQAKTTWSDDEIRGLIRTGIQNDKSYDDIVNAIKDNEDMTQADISRALNPILDEIWTEENKEPEKKKHWWQF